MFTSSGIVSVDIFLLNQTMDREGFHDQKTTERRAVDSYSCADQTFLNILGRVLYENDRIHTNGADTPCDVIGVISKK